MTRIEYMKELTYRLQGIDEKERVDAVKYCEEYFDEAGEENVNQAMEDLGTPSKFAAQIRAEAAIRSQNRETVKRPRSIMKAFLTIFLGLCALPIALPFLLVAIILVIVFIMVLIVLAIAAFIVILAMMFGAIPMIVGSFFYPFDANTFMRLGSGFMMISFGILTVIAMYSTIRIVIPWFMNSMTGMYNKAKGGTRHEEA